MNYFSFLNVKVKVTTFKFKRETILNKHKLHSNMNKKVISYCNKTLNYVK